MSRPAPDTPRFATLRRIPGAIWVLGFVSLLMDISSEMIHSLLPLFMVGSLGMSATAVGLIEGAAEATALIVKVFSGAISDRLGRRKPMALAGYGLAALSKPLFALAPGAGLLIAARFSDRLGKGLRGAPRDALIADIAPPGLRGAAFGLRQSLDTVGAFVGPLLAAGLMMMWAGDFRAVFWVACLPAIACVLLLAIGVREPDAPSAGPRPNPWSPAQLRQLGGAFWWVAALGGLFTLARFSEAFLVLRAQQQGIPVALVPLVMVAMNVVYAACAYPFGKLADRLPATRLLVASLLVLLAAQALLGWAQGWPWVLAGVALWGVHLGMSQGLLAALVAEVAPAALRGTAFGFFNLFCGLAMLVSGGMAGWLWDATGPASTFAMGGLCSLLALSALALRPRG